VFEVAALLAAFVPACNFSIGLGPSVSPETGDHPLALRLVNRGTRTCRVRGYPKLVLEDRHGRIPFVITHRGDEMVTTKPPVTVTVRPGRAAYVLLNHYRCDLGGLRAAAMLRIGASALRLTNPYRMPNWCGKGDPGSVLAVSPFEPTLGATLRYG
jgi:Domain of unknown function (DUF4232)